MSNNELVTRKLEAEFRAAEAKMDAMEADARARKAREQMEAVAGVQALRDDARQRVAELKARTAADLAEAKRAAEGAVLKFQQEIERVAKRFATWDHARSAHLKARLDGAEARVRAWKATAQAARTGEEIREHDALATLEEQIAIARARAAEWNQTRHEQRAAEAARDAARHFDEAYAAAEKRYDHKEESWLRN